MSPPQCKMIHGWCRLTQQYNSSHHWEVNSSEQPEPLAPGSAGSCHLSAKCQPQCSLRWEIKRKERSKRWTQFEWLHAKNILVTVSSTKIAIRNLIPQRIKAQTRILWTLPSCTVCINIRTTVITERTIRLTFSSWKGWDRSVLSLHVLPVHQ